LFSAFPRAGVKAFGFRLACLATSEFLPAISPLIFHPAAPTIKHSQAAEFTSHNQLTSPFFCPYSALIDIVVLLP